MQPSIKMTLIEVIYNTWYLLNIIIIISLFLFFILHSCWGIYPRQKFMYKGCIVYIIIIIKFEDIYA